MWASTRSLNSETIAAHTPRTRIGASAGPGPRGTCLPDRFG